MRLNQLLNVIYLASACINKIIMDAYSGSLFLMMVNGLDFMDRNNHATVIGSHPASPCLSGKD